MADFTQYAAMHNLARTLTGQNFYFISPSTVQNRPNGTAAGWYVEAVAASAVPEPGQAPIFFWNSNLRAD